MLKTSAIAYMTFSVVWGSVLPQQHSTSGLVITRPNTCSAMGAMSVDLCPRCLCTNDSVIALGKQALCLGQDNLIAGAVHGVLELESWCREGGVSINTVVFHLSPNQTAILDSLNGADEDLRKHQIIFLTLQIVGGHIGLVLLVVISLIVSTISRDPIYFNFCITWTISSVIFSLALYQDNSTHTINFPLSPQWSHLNSSTISGQPVTACAIQAALLNGVQPMTAFSTLTLMSKLWLDLRISIHGTCMKLKWIPHVQALIILLPHIILVSLFSISITQASNALPGRFYCGIESPLLRVLVPASTTLLLVLTLPFDVLLINMIFSHWSTFRHLESNKAISISIIVRLVIFSVYRIILAVASIWPITIAPTGGVVEGVSNKVPTLMDMFQGALPLVAFLVFGSTEENLAAVAAPLFWCMCDEICGGITSTTELSKKIVSGSGTRFGGVSKSGWKIVGWVSKERHEDVCEGTDVVCEIRQKMLEYGYK
ncbi:hypothetical protein K439DRAFT_1658277 [Ramaria rubella]|nr:hypothetical protein K439DRAFT_1658277 [Ramaria rubella]